jgi:hypothetical protein
VLKSAQIKKWVVPEKIHTPPPRGNFCRPEGEKKLFLIIVNVLGHPKGVGGLISYFLCGGGMDVFWNDPMNQITKKTTSKLVSIQSLNTFT